MPRPVSFTATAPAQDGAADSPRLAAALDALGALVCRGGRPVETAARLATGLPPIDALLGGGIPRCRLSELAGPDSTGRTALAFSLLASVTRGGELAAWVDLADAFDAASAAARGVVLPRLLWLRATRLRTALRATERLLEAGGFPLVVLDLPALAPAQMRDLGGAVWPRLTRAAAASNAALVVLSPERHSGVWAGLALSFAAGAAHFTNTPTLLDGRDIEVHVTRARTEGVRLDRAQGADASRVCVRLAAPAA
jgi:hypothetical protein